MGTLQYHHDLDPEALAELCAESGGALNSLEASLETSGFVVSLWEGAALLGLVHGFRDGARALFVVGRCVRATAGAEVDRQLVEGCLRDVDAGAKRMWLLDAPPPAPWTDATFLAPKRRYAPRLWPGVLSGLNAVVFSWAAVVLPWRSWTVFSLLTALVALAHGATAGLSAWGHRWQARAWRVQSWLSLAYLAYITWNVVQSAVYLSAIYGGLGSGVAVALAALWANVLLLTVPLSLWGLAATGGVRRASAAVGVLTLLIAVAGLAWTSNRVNVEPLATVEGDDPKAVVAAVEAVLPPWKTLPRLSDPAQTPSLFVMDPVECAAELTPGEATVVATYIARGKKATTRSVCLQAPTLSAALALLGERLRREGTRSSVKVDVLRGRHHLDAWPPVVEALSIRPGLDGVCEGRRCLMPWQMIARDAFRTFRPVKDIPDLSFGVGAVTLRRWLGRPDGDLGTLEGLQRITTHSLVINDAGEVHRLLRLRDIEADINPEALRAAGARAQRYILNAQMESGKFRYILHPFTGKSESSSFSSARHAGTAMMLCELGEDGPRLTDAINRALDALVKLEQRRGRRSLLFNPGNQKGDRIRFNGLALGLAALATCRPRVGARHDATIARLTRTFLDSQRPDGGFYTQATRADAEPLGGADRIYVPGQMMFALVMVEKLLSEPNTSLPGEGAPTREEIRASLDRAMTYFAEDYWSGFLSDFFFIEENWHCIAARAALEHHRHDGYEKFCTDYSDFKKRLILEEGSDVDADLIGSHGFGNVVMPQNTPTAGIGETLAAAMAVKQARGEDIESDRALMGKILTYLMRQPWSEVSCFGCAREPSALGGVSEHAATSVVRIDFVQHFWAAIRYGGDFVTPATKKN